MSEHGDILDFDQIGEENIMKSGEVFNKDQELKQKSVVKKKQVRKQKEKVNASMLLSAQLDRPKLSREERLNLQAMQLFQRMEQKEKKKDEVTRKKRKTNDMTSQASEEETNSALPEEPEKSHVTDDIPEPKSDSESFEFNEKPVAVKKTEPAKISSKYFNPTFDLKGAQSILGFLYEYSKQNTNRFSHKKMKPPGQNGRSADSNGLPKVPTPLFKTPDSEIIEKLSQTQKATNLKFQEHVKILKLEGSMELKDAFVSFKTE